MLTPLLPKKIKVARIIARMNVGGPAIQVCTITKGLPDGEFEQLLLTGQCDLGEVDYLELNDIHLPRVEVPGLGRSIDFLSDVRALFFIRKQLVAFGPDIIHTHTFKAGLLGRVASMTLRSNVLKIHTFHGHLLEGYLKGMRLWILVKIEQLLARKTDVLISVGRRVMDELIAEGIGRREQYRIIPPGFPIVSSLERETSVRTSLERQTEFVCAWVGRLVEIKRPERVLEIARALKERKSRVKFLVVGDGPERNGIEEQSEREQLPITFMGWRSDIHRILMEVDVLLLTSANEGTPISVIEAQRLGRPVIATDVGSVSEVIIPNETGFVLGYDIEKFVEKLELLAQNEDLYSRFSAAAKIFGAERFTSDRLVKDHMVLYRKSVEQLS